MVIRERVDAKKHPVAPAAALALLQGKTRLVASRGKKVDVFDLRKEMPDEATLLSYLIGRSGNLRAPTAVVGKTLLVGFNAEAYRQALGL